MKYILIFILNLISFFALSQPNFFNWYNNPANKLSTHYLVPRNDGSLICLVRTISATNPLDLGGDIYIFDSLGNVTFQQTFDDDDYPRGVSKTADCCFYAFNEDLLIKFDTLGNKIWEKEYYDTLQSINILNVFVQNNRLLIVGRDKNAPSNETRIVFLVTDLQGNVLSQHSWNNNHYINYFKVIESNPSNSFYYVSGSYYDSTNFKNQIFLLTVDTNGIIVSGSKATGPGFRGGFISNVTTKNNLPHYYIEMNDSSQGQIIGEMLFWNQIKWGRKVTYETMLVDNDSVFVYNAGTLAEFIEVLDTNGNSIKYYSWQHGIGGPGKSFRKLLKSGTKLKCFGFQNYGILYHHFDVNSTPLCPLISPAGSSPFNIFFTHDSIEFHHSTPNFSEITMNHPVSPTTLIISDPCNPTGINYDEANMIIDIFPNPASSTITINFTQLYPEKFTISIYDIYGKCIKTFENISSPENTIDLHGISNGMYVLNIQTGKSVYKSSFQVIN